MEVTTRRFTELNTLSKILLGFVVFGGIILSEGDLTMGIGQIIGAMIISGIITLFVSLIDLIFSRRFRFNLNVWSVGTFIMWMMYRGSSEMIQ